MRPHSALAAAVLSTAAVLLAPATAAADNGSSLTVIGTSDVSDSGLVQNVIQPEFHAAYPQYTFKYIGTATGTAINNAESGSQGASVLIVHAASLENQFVAGGYSYEPYGRALFLNDFVLAGPTGDPAGVASGATNNVAKAFADIASAGMNGGAATFVSRGGTPGTTVQEHQIWQLVDSSGLAPAGLLLCAVSSTNGGGETPIAAGHGVTASGQTCPNNGALPSASALPAWYAVNTGATQGPNVIAANACTSAVSPAGPGRCYVFTDRGTYDYLASGQDPAGSISNLTIVSRDNGATAPGGANELINFFHGYIISPSKPNEQVNLPAAQDLLNLITSASFQSRLKTYLDDTSDPAGAPFVADASPVITEIGLPTAASAGKKIAVKGTVTNAEPGYPPLAGKTVTLDEVVAGLPVAVATTTTDATGAYSITFTPKSSGAYQVATAQISMIENSYFSPPFGDLLSPAATTPVQIAVSGLPSAHTVRFGKVRVKRGRVTVIGTLSPAPALRGATIQLFALRTTGRGGEQRIARTSLGAGKRSFTLRARLPRGATYVLQLEYVQKGQTASYSGLRSLAVR